MRKRLLLSGILTMSLTSPVHGEIVKHFGHMVDYQAATSICLACHNGTGARAVSACDYRMCRIYGNHVIGVAYPVNGSKRFADRGEILYQGVELEEGKIGCYTCHDLRNTTKGQLVQVRGGEDICSACHRM